MRPPAAAIAIAVALALAEFASPPLGAAGDRFDFESRSGRFRIDFPGVAPLRRQLSGARMGSTTNNAEYAVTVDGAEFEVELHDIPRAASMLLSRDFILERAKRSALDDLGARELSSEPMSRQQQPARRVRYEVPERNLVGQLLLVLAGQRLYLVSARSPAGRHPPMTFADFAESFEFWLE